MLRRNKATVEASSQEPAWHVFEGDYDGSRMYARFNTAVGRAADRSSYVIQVGVAVPLLDPDADGLPQATELDALAAIEEQVVVAAEGRAVLVGVITTRSMREFVLYTRSPEWIAGFDQALHDRVHGHEVQVMAQKDPQWTVYRRFVA